MVAVYVLYNAGEDGVSGDTRSADLIVRTEGFLKLAVKITDNPEVQPPEIANNDIVCLGTEYANPYTKFYFPNLRFDSLYNPEKFPDQKEVWKFAGEFGISADGKYVIAAKKRANGTTVTLIAGMLEPDTWKAANVFVTPTISPLIPIGISGAAISGAIFASVR